MPWTLLKARLDFLTEESDRVHDPVVRDAASAIQLRQNSVEPELFLHFAQPL
jgi:hypothetical protein